jgi:2-phospho-L-lactate guanylyltransferase
MTCVVLVPVKEPARAKSRLSSLLRAEERALLCRAMLTDLIRALRPLPYPVALVTNSAGAARQARSLGWQLFWEGEQTSESASIDEASRRLEQKGIKAVLRLPADLPLIRPDDIDDLLSPARCAPGAVMVPSWNGRGTNALLRTPPTLFPSHFGPDSFALHAGEATAAGAHLRIVENPRLALDIDDPEDIRRFLRQPAEGRTLRVLTKLRVAERLQNYG